MNIWEETLRSWLEDRGFTVLRDGWPDFFCLKNAEDGHHEFMAVEAKTPGDIVRSNQKAMHDALEKIGVPVNIIKPEIIRDRRIRRTVSMNIGFDYYLKPDLSGLPLRVGT